MSILKSTHKLFKSLKLHNICLANVIEKSQSPSAREDRAVASLGKARLRSHFVDVLRLRVLLGVLSKVASAIFGQEALIPVLQITATQTSRLSPSRRHCFLAWAARRADDSAQGTSAERSRKADL